MADTERTDPELHRALPWPKRDRHHLREEAMSRREWERAGLVLSTGTAQDIRTAPDFGHREDCARRRKRRRR